MQYAIAALAFAATVVNAIPALAPAPDSSSAPVATATYTATASASTSDVLVTSIVYTTSEMTVISCDTTITYVFPLASFVF